MRGGVAQRGVARRGAAWCGLARRDAACCNLLLRLGATCCHYGRQAPMYWCDLRVLADDCVGLKVYGLNLQNRSVGFRVGSVALLTYGLASAGTRVRMVVHLLLRDGCVVVCSGAWYRSAPKTGQY